VFFSDPLEKSKKKKKKSYAKEIQLVELSLLTAVRFCSWSISGLYQEHLERERVTKKKAREGRENKSEKALLETL
jgi:hypothetical protein